MQHLLKLNKRTFTLFMLTIAFSATLAQPATFIEDLQLCNEIQHNSKHLKSKQAYIFKGEPASFKTLNPMSLAFGGSLYLYQNYITQHFSASCLYSPTCSHFSKDAVGHYGLIKGGLLTVDRLSRCNRIAATDLNPTLIHPVTHSFHDPIDRYK